MRRPCIFSAITPVQFLFSNSAADKPVPLNQGNVDSMICAGTGSLDDIMDIMQDIPGI